MRYLTKYFNRIEKMISAQYSVSTSSNPSDKGEDREDFLVDIFNNHLPAISKAYRGGTILDCWDKKSSQVDLVIYSSFSPLMKHSKKPLFLAEGTFAAIEVKSALNNSMFSDILDWSTRIKKLDKFILPKDRKIIGFGDTVSSICTGLFAYTSRIKDYKKILEQLFAYHKKGVPNYQMIDFVCINNLFCVYRHRTENIDEFKTAGGLDETEKRKNSLIYNISPYSFSSMFSNIIEYVSYIGPTAHWMSSYLNAVSCCDGKKSAE